MPRILFVLVVLGLLHGTVVEAQQDYFVEADVSNFSPYIGEQIVYSFRLYSRVNRTNQGQTVMPRFDGFWKEELGSVQKYDVLVNEQNYEVKEWRLALYAASASDLFIEPATFVIPDQPDRAGDVLLTDTIAIHVRPLPESDGLVGFDGGVGQYEIEPTLDRQSSAVGEPITLRLTVRGTGNLAELPSPALPQVNDWRIFPDGADYHAQEQDGRLVGEKTFEWLLTPLVGGSQILPAITFTYFDPDSSTYRSLSTAPFTFDILPVAEVTAPPLAAPVETSFGLKPVPAVLAVKTSLSNWMFPLLWVAPPGLVAGLWLRKRHEQRLLKNAALYRRSDALKRAHHMLRSAQKTHTPDGYHIIREGITGYVADKLNVPQESLSYLTIETALIQAEIASQAQMELLACLEAAEQGLYAPFDAEGADTLARRTTAALEALDVSWKMS